MSLLLLLFLLPLFHISSTTTSLPYPNADVSLFIDCGGTANFTAENNRTWLSDRYYSAGGAPAVVAEPHAFTRRQEQTLRFFPPASAGKRSCYSVPVPSGRYYVRLFTVYDNYDSKLHTPSFDVSVEGTLVFSWRLPWPDLAVRSGAYTDVVTYVVDDAVDVCFYSIGTDAPVVGSIEVVGVDPRSYDSSATGRDLVLVNYGRLTCGSRLFGPGFTDDAGRFSRDWQLDTGFLSSSSASGVGKLTTDQRIHGTDMAPDYLPERLYRTAVSTVKMGVAIEYLLPVDTEMDYILWFHFAEIDPAITKVAQRVFDIIVDRKNATRIDIFKEAGSFRAFKWRYVVKNLTNMRLSVRLLPVVGKPLISGLENYAMVPLEPATIPSQVTAMRVLKESLRIPDRMGWNGDPCAPSAWDAWEGVTCHRAKDGSDLVVTQLELASQGLKGYISDKISLLSNLLTLNLSSNSLEGTLPPGIGQESLVRLDLSGNQLSGSIPDSLGASSLQLVLLNNNQLEGKVPVKLYSVGVHGGEIDLSGNKGLCGVPSLPACSFFSVKGNFSTRIKIAIVLCGAVILCVILLGIYLCCIRGRRNDYDFVLSQDSTIAAKRTRYRRQKTVMHLEMEMQNS